MKPKIQPKKDQVKSSGQIEPEALLNELQKLDGKKEVQRFTVDFPQAMYDQIKQETEYRGQTMKGFITSLVRDYFNAKGQ
jgi:hypothetical protein